MKHPIKNAIYCATVVFCSIKSLILSCNTFCCCPIRKYSSLRKRYVRLLLSGEGSMQQQQQQQQQQRFAFHSDRESSVEPLTPGTGMYGVVSLSPSL